MISLFTVLVIRSLAPAQDAINWEAAAAAWELGTVRNTSGAMVVAMVQSCPHVKLADVDVELLTCLPSVDYLCWPTCHPSLTL